MPMYTYYGDVIWSNGREGGYLVLGNMVYTVRGHIWMAFCKNQDFDKNVGSMTYSSILNVFYQKILQDKICMEDLKDYQVCHEFGSMTYSTFFQIFPLKNLSI